MRPDVGDWNYVDEDGLPEIGTSPIWAACRAKDGSRPNWVACDIIYGRRHGTNNPWGIPILDDDNYEVYAWMYEWTPNPPKFKEDPAYPCGKAKGDPCIAACPINFCEWRDEE